MYSFENKKVKIHEKGDLLMTDLKIPLSFQNMNLKLIEEKLN
jgi:hypothetical protein